MLANRPGDIEPRRMGADISGDVGVSPDIGKVATSGPCAPKVHTRRRFIGTTFPTRIALVVNDRKGHDFLIFGWRPTSADNGHTQSLVHVDRHGRPPGDIEPRGADTGSSRGSPGDVSPGGATDRLVSAGSDPVNPGQWKISFSMCWIAFGGGGGSLAAGDCEVDRSVQRLLRRKRGNCGYCRVVWQTLNMQSLQSLFPVQHPRSICSIWDGPLGPIMAPDGTGKEPGPELAVNWIGHSQPQLRLTVDDGSVIKSLPSMDWTAAVRIELDLTTAVRRVQAAVLDGPCRQC
jgi:hypothetical protein